MASRSCVSGCGRFLTSSDGHDRCPACLGFKHAEAALVDESCSHCGNMTMAMLRSRYLLARRGGIPLALPRSSSSGRRTTSAQGQGDLRVTVRASPSSTPPRASHSSSTSHRLGFPDEYAGSSDRAGPSISFGAPADDRLSITASGDELGSGEDDLAALPPSGRVALPESDPELTAMLSRAAESIGLHYRRPPSPERSRLDDWFLGAQAERRQPPPVPVFPEVHEEVTRSWKAPFSARNRPSASSVLTTLDGGAAQGYVEVPPVERAIAMQLCPQGAAAWRGNPRLPSRACKFSSALTAKAYGAAGQAASALHAMALLQVHQAKALKQLHPGVMQELRTATDLALRATKVTARALGQTMSTLVVQERHLWLTLADMRESDKHRFLDSPISQAGLFGEAVEDFAQQFSAAQKQTEAFRHILPRRSAAVSTPPPAAAPPSARRRGRPPAASTSAPARPQQQPALRPQRGAGRRRPAQPASAPAKPVKRQGRRRPWDGRPGAFGSCSSGDGDCTTPSPGGGPGGESFVSFLFCSATDPRVSPGQFPFPPGPKRARMAVYETSSPHPRPPLSSPVGSRVRSEDATPSPASPAQLWSQVSVTPHTQTPLRDALPFESGPCAPFRCPTVGTSVTPLVPLARSLGAWLELPRPSRWLLRTIRLGYAIQFARRPPKFRGIRFTSVLSKDAPVLRAEVAVLLAKDAIEPVPPAEMKSGFYSPYFIVPKKGGGLRPILDLRVLNRALHKLPFRMLTQRRIFQCVRPLDWFAAIDLKDAYFHVSILPRHRPFLRFAFEGRAYQYKALPFGLSLSPRVFTKVVEAALVPLREAGIRILNYLDDWLILAQSRALLCEHRDMVLSHLSRLGLQVNREKSKLSPVQRISFLGMELDSVNLTARLSEERAQSMLRCLESLQCKKAVPLKHFQRLLGHMASSAAITPLGLLHMRPLQRWLHDRVPRWAWRHGTYRVSLTPSCRRTFSPWSDLAFLRAGVPLEQVSRHVVVSTDASATGWGAMCNGHAAAGLWTGPQLQWHINCLELLAVWLALRRFRTLLHEKHILVRSDNTATVAYINHQGGLRSRRMSQLARHLLLWSQKHLRSLRAVHVPGELNRAADELSRQHARVQGQGGRGASPLGCALLAQSDVVPRTGAPRDSPSLANSSEEGSTFSERGHPLAPAPRLVESPRMVLGRDAEVLSGLPPAVVNTITSARALSTRQAYRLKWNLFVDWCSPRREDPRRCPIAVVLSFLQDGLERRLSPSTLKVYVAAIAAHHDAVDGKSLGKHDLVIRFLRGARRLNPPRPHLVPSWDLPSVLAALRGAPFEPLQSVELKFLSLKTVLLSALATVKRVGDLQAFSVDDSCLEFGPADSHVVLRPRPGYVPKVPTMPFRDQVVNLQALPREEADPAIALLCPVRALRIYVDRTQSFRTSDQLFVCFGGQQKGRAVSKQRLAHWIVEAIVLAYQARRLPCPLGVRAHSTRGVASSWALARGASIADICKAAGWATPNTFARFYNLRIEPVSSRVLVSDGQ